MLNEKLEGYSLIEAFFDSSISIVDGHSIQSEPPAA